MLACLGGALKGLGLAVIALLRSCHTELLLNRHRCLCCREEQAFILFLDDPCVQVRCEWVVGG